MQASLGVQGGREAVPEPVPNQALEPTANSVRSAPAVGGGSPRAFGAQRELPPKKEVCDYA